MVELQQLIIGLLIMSTFVIGVSNFTGDLYGNYPNVQNASYISQSSKTQESIKSMTTDIKGKGSDNNIITIMLTGTWSILTTLGNVIGIFGSLINDVAGTLNMPSEFIDIFIAIVTITVIFGIIYLVMNMPR